VAGVELRFQYRALSSLDERLAEETLPSDCRQPDTKTADE